MGSEDECTSCMDDAWMMLWGRGSLCALFSPVSLKRHRWQYLLLPCFSLSGGSILLQQVPIEHKSSEARVAHLLVWWGNERIRAREWTCWGRSSQNMSHVIGRASFVDRPCTGTLANSSHEGYLALYANRDWLTVHFTHHSRSTV